MITTESTTSKFKPYTRQSIHTARQWQWLTPELQEAVQVVSHVLPFRVNAYVLEELIDWDKVPDDPIYRLTFPHRDMLPAQEYEQLRDLVLYKKDEAAIAKLVHSIRMRMNPHPAGQMTKKISTPMKPPCSQVGKAWNSTTDSTAMARRPSMSRRYAGWPPAGAG